MVPRTEPRGEPTFKARPGEAGSTKNNEECPRGKKKNRKMSYYRNQRRKDHVREDAV